ncbi:hypothetical protein I3F58_02445 [Streptomyces sp. MUM 203J]|uniref:hypothetical protein n=1 Tax=Streptomyces sp. MUM 203J TaxID=2791990 RepID=UPI001F0429F6|nr:hypothetical protein [Streptomyces sp. MUM 203J]MCH0538438.1 hypothetical protein [Streptomyces sp. MUM 203J]
MNAHDGVVGQAEGRRTVDADTLVEDVRLLLREAEIRAVGRAAGMGVVEFTGPQGEDLRVHIQCAFRIFHDGRAVLGSRDMAYAPDSVGPEAFDTFSIVYDTCAALLTCVMAGARPRVQEVHVGNDGTLTVEATRGLRVGAFPGASPAEAESWRAFQRHGPHYGHPPEVI